MIFRPKYTIDTIYHLDSKVLNDMGIKAVFSDLDNTLLAWNKSETAIEMSNLNKKLQADGIRLIVVSNNSHERVGRVLDPYNITFISNARKPLPIGINREKRKLDLTNEEILMVGDQLLTDILAGNLASVKTVLVKPLVETDKWNTQINRFFEKIIFFFLRLHKPVTFKERLE